MATSKTFDYAAQFAEPAPEELTLPSGTRVLVRRPDILVMARAGLIPDALTPIVENWVFEKEKTMARTNAPEQEPGARLKNYAEFFKYVDVMVVGACVGPVVRFAPKGAEIHPDQIHVNDRIAIWRWTEGLPLELAAFPDGGTGQGAGVPPVADVQGPESAPEPDDQSDRAA